MRLTLILLLLLSSVVRADGDYQTQLNAVFQIRVLDAQADQKSSIGSGFAVSGDGYLITNYHVIQSVVNFPNGYRLEVISATDEVIESRVVAVDVINDLALLKIDIPLDVTLQLAAEEPSQGARILSFGNPMDLGQTIVPGTWNGEVAHRFHRLINFSGALNSGMSGGPALNSNNEVVGVNVAGYGNNLSLLVPLSAVATMVSKIGIETPLDEQVSEQLLADEAARIEALLAGDWSVEPLGGRPAIAAVTDFISCWGASNNDQQERRTNVISRSCRTREGIYLNRHLQTGSIIYNQMVVENIDLSPLQFEFEVHDAMNLGRQSPSDTDYVGPMSCHEAFLEGSYGGHKTIVCVRAYKRFAPLYDVYFKIGSPPQDGQVAMTALALEGVSKSSAQQVIDKLLETVL
ncbi:S1C family serine protease [Umboniibacter marinipuniceus]|uniref:Trypsin-like peptidase n=1 Tax=Umboniibacter marinipuniceus TaxID=569599 RepID=A0A3M0A4Y8_9GAMM|nr:serine protease [Umboniibacter marinipuniceus]RMA80231.1 trypsin-like peptidase [Umboniibacter marinipuniceus]